MPTDPMAPPAWLTFLIMFAAVLVFSFLLWLNYTVQQWWRGLGKPRTEPAAPSDRPARARSQRPAFRSRRQNAVQRRSPQQNAENADVHRSPEPFTVHPNDANLPQNMLEMQRLAHALTLYAQRPNKQIAIETAFECTKGKGAVWSRASALFDAAVPPKGATAKAVEEDLKMEPVP